METYKVGVMMNRYSRIAENMVTAYGARTFGRDFYIPHGEHAVNLQKDNPAGTDLEVYTYEDQKGNLYGMAFAGKQNKPLWHYRFRSEFERQRRIQETVAGRKERAEYMDKRRQERMQYRHDLKVGDILVSSWGYDQTNVDFYEVVEAGEKSVKIREIDGKIVPSSERTQDKVVPDLGKYKGPAMVKMVGPGGRVKVRSFAWAHKWDGTPQRQTAFGSGH